MVTAIFAVIALSVALAVPASGQEFGPLQISPHEGRPGDAIDAAVDPNVVAESCELDIEAFQAEFHGLASGQIGSGALENAVEQWVDERWGESADLGVMYQTDPEAFAVIMLAFSMIGIAFNVDGATDDAFAQTFTLTFADVVTQQPVGELSTFDPFTGAGAVEVPVVDPGIWAVAAVCLGWNHEPTADETIAPAIAAGTAWVIENLTPPYPELSEQPGSDFVNALREGAPAMFGADPLGEGILQARGGPWVDLFCVVEADGHCHPDLRDLVLEDELFLLEEELWEDLLAEEHVAEAVGASPRFTG